MNNVINKEEKNVQLPLVEKSKVTPVNLKVREQ